MRRKQTQYQQRRPYDGKILENGHRLRASFLKGCTRAIKTGFNVARLLPEQLFASYQFAENFKQSPERIGGVALNWLPFFGGIADMAGLAGGPTPSRWCRTCDGS